MATLIIDEHKKNESGGYDDVRRITNADLVNTEDGNNVEEKLAALDSDKQDKITGTQGQLVGFDGQGNAVAQDAPDIGVATFNGRSGAVVPQSGDYTAEQVGARANTWMPTATEVGADPAGSASSALESAKQYTDEQIDAIPTPDVSGPINTHNTSPDAHRDIRSALSGKETAGAAAAVQSNLDSHIQNKQNPHDVEPGQIGAVPVGRKVNNKTLETDVTLTAADVGADASGSAAQALQDAKTYTDQKIDDIPTPDVSGQINAHNTNSDAHANMGWLTHNDSIDADSLGGVAASNYATTSYVNSVVGNINSVLDEINGEVV